MTDYHPRGLRGTGGAAVLCGVAADIRNHKQRVTGLLLGCLDLQNHICAVSPSSAEPTGQNQSPKTNCNQQSHTSFIHLLDKVNRFFFFICVQGPRGCIHVLNISSLIQLKGSFPNIWLVLWEVQRKEAAAPLELDCPMSDPPNMKKFLLLTNIFNPSLFLIKAPVSKKRKGGSPTGHALMCARIHHHHR